MRCLSKNGICSVSRRISLTAILVFGGVSLEVHPAWAAVTAPPASLSVTEDVAQTFSVAASSTVRRDTLTYSMETQASHGTVQLVSGRTFQYVPASNYNGTDSFTFKAVSAADGSYGIGTISIAVAAANDRPSATSGITATTTEDILAVVSLSGSDPDGDRLSYSVVSSSGTHGTVSVDAASGQATYTPDTNFNGIATFSYSVSDGYLTSGSSVQITVSAANDAPIATAQTLSLDEDASSVVSLSATDDATPSPDLTYTIVTQPEHGTLTSYRGNVAYLYTPDADYHGTDSFSFAVSDGSMSSSAATVSLTINSVDDAPVAYPVTAATLSDQSVTLKLFGTDADGSRISYAITTSPRHGSLMQRGGRVTYAPERSYTGADSFAYATVSGGVTSEAVTVRVSVSPQPLFDRAAMPQFGVNFIPFFSNDALQPDVVFADLETMGAQTFRQNGNGDVYWSGTEMRDGVFNFTSSDQTLTSTTHEPIPTLFRLQYASPTPPWESDPARFQKTVGTEARDYIDQTVGHFADVVRYWEIGNEMNHWVAADGGVQPEGMSGLSYPTDGFSPEEQALFLREAAEEIRAVDPDAVIVLPGISGLEDNAQDWLRRVVTAQGSDWFDVVNYHYYGDWARFPGARASFQECLDELGLQDKPVWMTETGSASDAETDVLTNYPNSDTSQSSDVFRRVLAAYGAGESLVMWHSYWDNQENRESNFFSFGLVDDGVGKASYAAAQLLTSELLPFTQVTALSEDADGMMIYRVVTRDGLTKHVAWGSGSFSVPDGTTQMVSVYAVDGGYEWQSVAAGDIIELSDIPVILK